MRKRIFLYAAVFVLSCAIPVFAATNISIDGIKVPFTTSSGSPFVDSANRTQVPLRVAMEAYGCSVSWDSSTQTATVSKDGKTVAVQVGQNYILKNGEQEAIDSAALIKDGRVYLPIRAVLEAFGASVGWDSSSQTVTVNSSNQSSTTQTTNPGDYLYVGNSNTMKFHNPDCRYVDQISDDHLAYFKTRQDAINAGYVPCKVCNP